MENLESSYQAGADVKVRGETSLCVPRIASSLVCPEMRMKGMVVEMRSNQKPGVRRTFVLTP